jgi:hypothetical protein
MKVLKLLAQDIRGICSACILLASTGGEALLTENITPHSFATAAFGSGINRHLP